MHIDCAGLSECSKRGVAREKNAVSNALGKNEGEAVVQAEPGIARDDLLSALNAAGRNSCHLLNKHLCFLEVSYGQNSFESR